MCGILYLLIFLHPELMRSPGYYLSQWAWWMLSSFGSHFEISVLLFGWKWIGVAQIIDGILQNRFFDLSILLWALITMHKKSVLQSLHGMWQCCSITLRTEDSGTYHIIFWIQPLCFNTKILFKWFVKCIQMQRLDHHFLWLFSFWLPNFKIK